MSKTSEDPDMITKLLKFLTRMHFTDDEYLLFQGLKITAETIGFKFVY